MAPSVDGPSPMFTSVVNGHWHFFVIMFARYYSAQQLMPRPKLHRSAAPAAVAAARPQLPPRLPPPPRPPPHPAPSASRTRGPCRAPGGFDRFKTGCGAAVSMLQPRMPAAARTPPLPGTPQSAPPNHAPHRWGQPSGSRHPRTAGSAAPCRSAAPAVGRQRWQGEQDAGGRQCVKQRH